MTNRGLRLQFLLFGDLSLKLPTIHTARETLQPVPTVSFHPSTGTAATTLPVERKVRCATDFKSRLPSSCPPMLVLLPSVKQSKTIASRRSNYSRLSFPILSAPRTLQAGLPIHPTLSQPFPQKGVQPF